MGHERRGGSVPFVTAGKGAPMRVEGGEGPEEPCGVPSVSESSEESTGSLSVATEVDVCVCFHTHTCVFSSTVC